MNGRISSGDKLLFMQAGTQQDAVEIGVRRPVPTPVAELGPGEVGYLIAGIKDVGEARSGETVTDVPPRRHRGAARLPRPEADGVLRSVPDRRRRLRELLRESLEKLKLNDASHHLRARVVGCARLRLPLRLPRACCTWRS